MPRSLQSVSPFSRLFVVVVAVAWLTCESSFAQISSRSAKSPFVVKEAGVMRGIVALLGADWSLAVDLKYCTELLIYVREPSTDAVDAFREKLEELDIGIDRIVVEQGPVERLPFADNTVDIVIASKSDQSVLAKLSAKEVMRVLRPEGTALLTPANASDSDTLDFATLSEQVRAAGGVSLKQVEGPSQQWLVAKKPPMPGADDWTHWEHGADNNPVSSDSAIKAPYMTQFMAHPMYIGMPSITTAAGGRTFLAIGHISHHPREWDTLYKLIARNGYNGTVLWKRDLPEGYWVHRSAFIATKDTFFMLDGDGCLLLDPETGVERERLSLPDVNGEWKWMVLKDNVLYVMSGKWEQGTVRIKGDREVGGWSWADLSPEYYGEYSFGFGDTIVAFDLSARKTLWTHQEETPIDSRAMAIRDGKVYLFCPEWHIRALSEETGEVLWTNADTGIRDLISEPGKGLTSTPGFKSMCLAVATSDALIIQGQTRMNVVGISTKDGSLLWTKRKITNNPNPIFVNGEVVLGVGPRGAHVVIDPVSGDVKEQLAFFKQACTRLTACEDSFFCRGEGTMRYDRATKKVMIDGAARPACNDGALPANGMLYIGPWQCDCNLSLIGSIAKCSAGDFRFDHVATNEDRLQQYVAAGEAIAPLDVSDADWPTLRGDLQRTSSSPLAIAGRVTPSWQVASASEDTVAPPVAAGDFVFVAGTDGNVRAYGSHDGKERWTFATAAPIKSSPTVWNGRLYVGSGDGYAYCLEAATGRPRWRFRAAPVERHIMVYGNLSSTWPVNSGVTINDGVAYFAAGIIDSDGTYVYAVDATTGELKWQNNSAGHLSPELRKGVSVQGNMTVMGDQLLLAGGNQVSPAIFDISTGELRAKSFAQGQPKSNSGQFVGAFLDKSAIVGGRILYSAADNVATKGNFVAFSDKGAFALNYGGIPPAWNDETIALVNFKFGKIACFDTSQVVAGMTAGSPPNSDARRWVNLTDEMREAGKTRWESDLGEGNKFEAVAIAVCPDAILAVVKQQLKFRARPQWNLAALNVKTGKPLWQQELQGEPLPGGLLVDRHGQIVVTMLDGSLRSFSTAE
ncbi:MAG: PQQ-binding-like beta-propeller repeat protein [Planctomycetota bacterium]|nr:PQQ-binding-like beta-propeller repeat protein [Planctomycetota bacterium]